MENENQTQATVTTEVAKKEEAVGKTFTQSDMDSLASKVRSEEKAKSEKVINEAITNAIAEYERKAKLTAEEREKEARSQREKELAQREKDITLRERTIEAKELLAKEGLSSDLVKYIVSEDGEKMKDNIKELTKTFNKAVESSVQEKLKGQAPKDFTAAESTAPKFSGARAF